MLAKRKIDGKIITLVSRTRADKQGVLGCFRWIDTDGMEYQACDLDFDVEEAEQTESAVISCWVARDNNGTLWICSEEPQRYSDWWIIDTDEDYTKKELPSYLFPSLTWESEPQEVDITIKAKKK